MRIPGRITKVEKTLESVSNFQGSQKSNKIIIKQNAKQKSFPQSSCHGESSQKLIAFSSTSCHCAIVRINLHGYPIFHNKTKTIHLFIYILILLDTYFSLLLIISFFSSLSVLLSLVK